MRRVRALPLNKGYIHCILFAVRRPPLVFIQFTGWISAMKLYGVFLFATLELGTSSSSCVDAFVEKRACACVYPCARSVFAPMPNVFNGNEMNVTHKGEGRAHSNARQMGAC